MPTYIKEGFGFHVGQDFARAAADMPIELALSEHAHPGHVIGYIAGNPASSLGFLRSERVRVHVERRSLGGDVPAATPQHFVAYAYMRGREVRSNVRGDRLTAARELFAEHPTLRSVSTCHSISGWPNGNDVRSHKRSVTV